MMRSLLLVLTIFPLALFAIAVNHLKYEVENGTTSDMYQLQDRYEGNTFFKYAEADTISSFVC